LNFLLQDLFKFLNLLAEIIGNGFQTELVVRQAPPGVPVMAASLWAGVGIGSNAGLIQL